MTVRPARLQLLRLLFALFWAAMAVEAAASVPNPFLEDDDRPSLSASSPTEILPLRQDVQVEIRLAQPANPRIALEPHWQIPCTLAFALPAFRPVPRSHAPPPRRVRGRPCLSRAPPLT